MYQNITIFLHVLYKCFLGYYNSQEIVDEDLANFRRIREEQDREYAESLAIDEAKLYNVCKLV